MRRSAFTLSEVAISLLLVSMVVVTIFLLVPIGIRTQTTVRYRVLAAAKAMEMLDLLRNGGGPGMIADARDKDKEGVFPWDSSLVYKSSAPDLEAALESIRGTIKPLPEAIAYRLDSENDEIRELLDAGGRIYYFFPGEPSGVLDQTNTSGGDAGWDPLYRKLLVGVVGDPQQNAILYHPSTKLGPYQAFYPSPPTHGKEKQLSDAAGSNDWRLAVWRNINYDALCRDPRIADVLISTETYQDPDTPSGDAQTTTRHFGLKPYSDALGGGRISPEAHHQSVNPAANASAEAQAAAQALFTRGKRTCAGYVVAALHYAKATGLDGLEQVTPANAAAYAATHATQTTQWQRVLGLRYLAHAAACLPRWYPTGFPASGVALGGSPVAQLTLGGTNYSNVVITLDMIRGWHEASLRLAVLHADLVGPYHWGAPRPLNRQVMMDHPLVQLDPWSDPITQTVTAHVGGSHSPYIVGGQTTRRQWRALYPQAIVEPGLPFSFPGRAFDTDGNGVVDARDETSQGGLFCYPARVLDTDNDKDLDDLDTPVPASGSARQAAVGPVRHFNLTAPFAPSERCRQLVFWAVDWQSYRDFETAPSADIDASRYPIVAPMSVQRTAPDAIGWNSEWVQRNDDQRQRNVQRGASVMGSSVRNPEIVAVLREPSIVDGQPTAAPVFTIGEINDFGGANENYAINGQAPDLRYLGTQPALPASFGDKEQWNLKLFLGRFGVNRNNVVLDFANPKNSGYPCVPGWDGRDYPRARVDVGPVAPSVRLRAITVCRFNFYDSRVQGALFQ